MAKVSFKTRDGRTVSFHTGKKGNPCPAGVKGRAKRLTKHKDRIKEPYRLARWQKRKGFF